MLCKRIDCTIKLPSKLFAKSGRLDSVYDARGNIELYITRDFPDHASETTVALTVTSTGTITGKTTALLTPEEIDEAAKKTLNDSPPEK